MSLLKQYRVLLSIIVLLAIQLSVPAQRKIITGVVQDASSEEPIPFASVSFTNSTTGKLTDSSGSFTFRLNNWPSDTVRNNLCGLPAVPLHHQ